MSTWEKAVTLVDNPLIVKDAVSRMRSWRAPVVLTLYLSMAPYGGNLEGIRAGALAYFFQAWPYKLGLLAAVAAGIAVGIALSLSGAARSRTAGAAR